MGVLGSSSKFAVYVSVVMMAFTIIATSFSVPESALRDHFILAELLGAPMGVITGAMFKRLATSKAKITGGVKDANGD